MVSNHEFNLGHVLDHCHYYKNYIIAINSISFIILSLFKNLFIITIIIFILDKLGVDLLLSLTNIFMAYSLIGLQFVANY